MFLFINLYNNNSIYAQNITNPISTTVPFLRLLPNAELNGIGNIGVVTLPGNYSSGIFSNPALLNANGRTNGIIGTYNSKYRKSFSLKYSPIDSLSISYSFFYFDLGTIEMMDSNNVSHNYHSFENYHSLRMGYSINSKISIGLGGKYFTSHIFSDLWNIKPVKSFAIDLGILYHDTLASFRENIFFYNLGIGLINLGPKISYDDNTPKGFIPSELNIGGCLLFSRVFFSSNFQLGVFYQTDKLLVPTPPIIDINGEIVRGEDPDRSSFNALFTSFNDAPNGFVEEKQEFIHHYGFNITIDLINDIHVSFQMGKTKESKYKGNLNYLAYGFGLGYKGIFINYSKQNQKKGKSSDGYSFISTGYMFKFN